MRKGGFSKGDRAWWHWGLVGVVVLQAAAALYAVVRSLHWPLLHDVPPIHYMSWRIASGAVPYLEVFDMNMPGTYVIHMAVLQVLGTGDAGWRAFDLLMLALAAGVMVWYLRGHVPPVLLGLAALLFVTFHLGNGPVFAGQRDFVMVPFLAGAGYGLLRALAPDAPRMSGLFWAGLCLGGVACIKPPAALFGVWVLVLWLRFAAPAARVRGVLVYGVGALAVPLLTLVWLVQVGALAAFWDTMTGYVLPYYSQIEGQYLSATLIRYQGVLTFGLFAAGMGVALWPRLQRARLPGVVLGLVVLYGLLHFVMQGKSWPYHTYPFFYGLFLLLVLTWGRWLQRPAPGLRVAACIGLVLLALPLTIRAVRTTTPSYALADVKPWVPHLMADIAAYNLPEAAQVEVLDTTTGGIHALYLLRRPQASRFVYDFHFYHHTDTPVVQDLRRTFIQSLETKKPALVVLMDKGWLPPHGMDRIEAFPALKQLLRAQYTVDKVVPGQYTLYRRTAG